MIQVLWRRRLWLLLWCLGVFGADALLAVAYPTIRDNSELDKTFAGLPPGVQAALGLQAGAITSPAGYLNSQYFANILPILLLVLAIGLAAWSIGGDEGAGTMELLLENPISRMRVALERAGALVAELAAVTVIAGAGLLVLAPATGLNKGLSPDRIAEAAVAAGLLALTFSSIAFGVGAATGSRGAAITTAAAISVALFMIEGFAAQVNWLRPIREASPWHWFLGTDPIRNGLLWQSWVLPLTVSAALILLGSALFVRRDLR
ncbi:MAG: ABC transporter permease subunit [Candidatus Dormibacter sp.]